jgi:hypothetical protein
MRWKRLAGVVAMAAGALAMGALFGRPGTGHAAGGTPPNNTATPTISGVPQEGQTLTAHHGTWDGSPTSYTYAWGRCDANGDNCSPIAGAVSSDYTLVAADVGQTLRVTVIATNGTGDSAPSTSAPTAVVSSASAPKNTAPPTISGSLQVGSTLTATNGTWTNNVTGYAYAWQRCDKNGNSCATISGATSTTYKLTQADVGTTLRVIVTATNGAGSTSATSVPTKLLPLPAVTGCPSGTGTIQIADLKPPARLSIDQQTVTPSPVTRSASAITLRFRVTACGGRPVQGANVFGVSIPYNQFKGQYGATGPTGTVTLTEPRQTAFPATRQQRLLAVLLRASKPGESVVGGISTRVIVSFPVAH